ncbi:sulfatase family protein [Zavarzinella formosa]|uniref:sulfatase family protein n=1 Tax=Zavarzinella formosa TaxID=360055 RepID=UPI0002EBBA38|nr:sulfatase-like hydrolase/transferase [Zavarzinella formosa]
MRCFPWLMFFFVVSPIFAAEPPNVLMIVGDDWGWTDFGFMGHPEIKTPHLDRLAKEGVLFPNGYTPTSLCRASLATILTGQFAHEHRICCNDPPAGIDRDEMLPFLKNAPALPRLLQDRKYQSFQTGKFWEGPFQNGGFTHGMTTKGRHGEEGLVIGRQTLEPIHDFITKSTGPWFVWYAPMMPHEPHTPPERILKKYAKEGRDPRLAKYWAMCEWTDETVGELLKWLEEKKLRDNLLIVFVVDNGWVQSTGPVKKGDQFETRSKNSAYDAGVRTPIILHGKMIGKRQRREELVSTVDLAPTIIDVCGVESKPKMSGESLMALLNGTSKRDRNKVFGEIYLHTAATLKDPQVNLTHRWVRHREFKLILPTVKDSTPELFDIVKDPMEKTDLAASHPEKVAALTKILMDEWNGWPTKKP